MQRPDERKRSEIMRTAARMFAERPYHEVRLDEIAAATRLGKGTIYVYFASKDDLHTTLIAEGIDQLITEVQATTAAGEGAWPAIERAVDALLAFADRFPHIYTLMRSALPPQEGLLAQKRRELARALARILRRGVVDGALDDPHPELTAEFLLSSVRGALLFPPKNLGRRAIARHILRVIGRGLLARKRSKR
ncbi:MAG TPA: TetR/AcrR family transcriptional regulator [Planctomycetota bacterium]